jgi:hypothetical protein
MKEGEPSLNWTVTEDLNLASYYLFLDKLPIEFYSDLYIYDNS